MNVRFVKRYTNYVGRVFLRFERDARPGDEIEASRVVDVCIRESRTALESLTRAEARVLAEQRLNERVES